MPLVCEVTERLGARFRLSYPPEFRLRRYRSRSGYAVQLGQLVDAAARNAGCDGTRSSASAGSGLRPISCASARTKAGTEAASVVCGDFSVQTRRRGNEPDSLSRLSRSAVTPDIFVLRSSVRCGLAGASAACPRRSRGRRGSTAAPGVLYPLSGQGGAGQPGCGRAARRFQQVVKTSRQGQSVGIRRILRRAWKARRAGRCQSR
jgi:hypothetical protein